MLIIYIHFHGNICWLALMRIKDIITVNLVGLRSNKTTIKRKENEK